MDREYFSSVQNTEKFWEKTEDSEAQKDITAAMSNYTSLFLGRVQKLDLPLSEENGIQNNQSLHEMVQTDNITECDENQKAQEETGTKESVKDMWEIGGDTVPLERLVKIFDQGIIISANMDFSRQTYLGLIPASGHLIYAFADYLASLTHAMSSAPFINAGACQIEESVINWVKRVVGYPDTSNGVTVSGTSMGAVVAFSAARDHLLQSSKHYNKSVLYVAEHTHLSSIRSLRVVGLGGCVYRNVPSVKHRIVAHTLEKMITEDTRHGLIPFLVIASMGGTCMGALDPFDEIREITQKHNVWFHVDAAYGGFFLLDDTVRARCSGLNMADSITLDFHKGLSAPCGTAAVLIREGHILSSAMARGSAPYIQTPEQGTGYSPIELCFEYTRPFRAFPVWLMLKVVGTEAVRSQLTEKIKLTKYAYDILSRMQNVSVYMEPDLSIIAFRCSKGNEMTRKWLQMINQEGSICTTSTETDSKEYIRMCILSFRTHLKAVDMALSSIKRTLDVIIENEQNCS